MTVQSLREAAGILNFMFALNQQVDLCINSSPSLQHHIIMSFLKFLWAFCLSAGPRACGIKRCSIGSEQSISGKCIWCVIRFSLRHIVSVRIPHFIPPSLKSIWKCVSDEDVEKIQTKEILHFKEKYSSFSPPKCFSNRQWHGKKKNFASVILINLLVRELLCSICWRSGDGFQET